MFFWSEPSEERIQRFLCDVKSEQYSYLVGRKDWAEPRNGYCVDTASAHLGVGRDVFDRARHEMEKWSHFDLGWMRAVRDRQGVEPGVNVAIVVAHLGFWSLNSCRIVRMIESSEATTRFGFVYGTLLSHAECGEESFEIALEENSKEVTYNLKAISQPRSRLAQLGYPYTRWLQSRFRRDSCSRMIAAAGSA